MKETIHIEADFDKPDLLKNMVEQLVSKKKGRNLPKAEKEMIETASTEAFVCGTIHFDENGSTIRMPFDSSFLFTCTLNRSGKYEIAWSASLS